MLGHVLREIAKKFQSRPPVDVVAPPYNELWQRALEFQNAGDAENAIACLREIIGKNGGHAQALCNLGTLLASRGELDFAQQLIERSVASDPSLATAHVALGNLHQIKKDYMSAEKCYRRALVQEPEHSLALCNLGLLLIRHQRVPEAEEVLRQCVATAPTFADAHHNLGFALRLRGAFDEAIACFRKALTLQPTLASALKSYVALLAQTENYETALIVTTEALASQSDSPIVQAIHAFALHKVGRIHDAISHYEIALRSTTSDCELLDNYGTALQDLGRFAEAQSCYERALVINPDYHPARWHFALLVLLQGDYARGWLDYDLRTKSELSTLRNIPFPRWNGEPNANATLLVYAEQGLGDEIMFASCVKDAAARVGKVIVECNGKLAPIFKRSFSSVSVIGAPQDSQPTWLASLPKVDYAIPVGSLPQFFRSSLSDFGSGASYLRADGERARYWRDWLATLGPGLKVGISWQGGSRSSRRDLRSIPLPKWLPILQQPRVQFVNLQYTPCRDQLQQLHSQNGILINHRQDAIDDYDETAALVSALDLVISVQTAVIHLSGALGTPTWVMVPVCPEWRYGATGERMPWYGSVRLFRQRQWNDWQETIETVARELARRAT